MIGDLLELVDLAGKRDAYVQTLSRGMQQRLCLAHALVHDPQVLLLDEPASGLDPRARVELRELLRELRAHGQDDRDQQPHPPRARGAVHGVAIIDRGQVLAQGRVDEIEELRFGGGTCGSAPVEERPTQPRRTVLRDPKVASAVLLDGDTSSWVSWRR